MIPYPSYDLALLMATTAKSVTIVNFIFEEVYNRTDEFY